MTRSGPVRFVSALFFLCAASVARAVVTPPWDPFFAAPATAADVSPIVPSTTSNRAFGIAAGDFDGDARGDVVVGRTDGRVFFLKGGGDGTFAPPSLYAWKLETFNAWAFAAADVNGDGHLDVVWGANAAGADAAAVSFVNDGDVRVLFGNGNGTFQISPYIRSGITFNAGTLLADVGTDAGSVAAGDVDGDGDADVVAGAVEAPNSVVKILTNPGIGAFTVQTLISQPTACATPCSPVYFPAISTQNSPWGLALGDADGDSDLDLFVGDRALYVYLFVNGGGGVLTMQTGNSGVPASRTNAYLAHDVFRAAVGFTASLAAGDVNGDGKADLALGLHSGTQTPASGTANDGTILLDVSTASGHTGFGAIADVGTMARGVNIADVNGDGYRDVVAGEYDGKVKLLRQLAPTDSDGDGVSDYTDNAPFDANAARIDMNTDASINHRDQLDNDFDTILGDPENALTWDRLGDPADPDDDNDGVADTVDNCPFVANGGQEDGDGDGSGDACDPLIDGDTDTDGVPDGPDTTDAFYAASRAAKIKWSSGTTRFVIRIDALGRIFQNEFTQILTDAAALSPGEWATKCWENYEPTIDPPDPCGPEGGAVTLPGGKSVPVSVVVIPKQLWTDAPVVAWINDRNDNPLLEVGQHGTYHFDNTPLGDWATLPDRNFFSCEACGLTESESFELMKVGYDTLLGNYSNKWIAESGATPASPKIDWSTSANPLLSFAPPFNTSDSIARKALAQLSFKAFSASVFEEEGFYSSIFSPEGSHHERFDQFGMFHVSADLELEPPDTTGDVYDTAAYEQYLRDSTNVGGLTTWLIEEVEWSGRPCQNADRLCSTCCNGGTNRENNTVYVPRWNGWMQLLDFVKSYAGGVALTMGEVALARSYDNAPTASNPGQEDADLDGIGDVVDGAAIVASDPTLTRNVAGTLEATLRNGAGNPIASQSVVFAFDAAGDGTVENYVGTTDATGKASVTVTPTRPVGAASFTASWDGGRGLTATDLGAVSVRDQTTLTMPNVVVAPGQPGIVRATLRDSDFQPLAGKTIAFTVQANASANSGFVSLGTALTDASGVAQINVGRYVSSKPRKVRAAFAGDAQYGASSMEATVSQMR
ncbi:MAG: FG-GAP-like repeat-containing protein [Acidobacteriota bacterium]|nr:FG-GAP-like repeat-containing protein [Acidobacteriota bacterium]